MDGGNPCGADVAVGDVGHVEGLSLAALHADHDEALVRVDRSGRFRCRCLCVQPGDYFGGKVRFEHRSVRRRGLGWTCRGERCRRILRP